MLISTKASCTAPCFPIFAVVIPLYSIGISITALKLLVLAKIVLLVVVDNLTMGILIVGLAKAIDLLLVLLI